MTFNGGMNQPSWFILPLSIISVRTFYFQHKRCYQSLQYYSLLVNSSLELGMFSRRSYFCIVIDTTIIIQKPSKNYVWYNCVSHNGHKIIGYQIFGQVINRKWQIVAFSRLSVNGDDQKAVCDEWGLVEKEGAN